MKENKNSHRKITMTYTQTTYINRITLRAGKKRVRPAKVGALASVFEKSATELKQLKLLKCKQTIQIVTFNVITLNRIGQLPELTASAVDVRIQDVALKTYRRRWTIERSGERGSGISVLAARLDDDDDDEDDEMCSISISKNIRPRYVYESCTDTYNVRNIYSHIHRNPKKLKTIDDSLFWFRYETFIYLFEFKVCRHEERETHNFFNKRVAHFVDPQLVSPRQDQKSTTFL